MDIGSVQSNVLAQEDNLIAPEMDTALGQSAQMENRQPVFAAPLGEAPDIAPQAPLPHSQETDEHVQRLVQQLADMKIGEANASSSPTQPDVAMQSSLTGEALSSSATPYAAHNVNYELPFVRLLKTIRKWTDVRFVGKFFLEKLGFHVPTWLKHHSKVVKTEQEIASMNVKGDYGI